MWKLFYENVWKLSSQCSHDVFAKTIITMSSQNQFLPCSRKIKRPQNPRQPLDENFNMKYIARTILREMFSLRIFARTLGKLSIPIVSLWFCSFLVVMTKMHNQHNTTQHVDPLVSCFYADTSGMKNENYEILQTYEVWFFFL